MTDYIERFFGWMTSEPAIGLLMIVVTLTLFVSALRHNTDASKTPWFWVRRMIEASLSAVLFLGMLWGFRAILINNAYIFNITHGSVSENSLRSAQSIWGRPHVQREMTLVHYITVVEKKEVSPATKDGPAKFVDEFVQKEVPQNPILGFTGQFDLLLSEREKGYALYSGFLVHAKMSYDIINDSDLKTEANFVLPLAPDQTIFDGFQIFMDGKDLGPLLRYEDDHVAWKLEMEPHQKSQIKIKYSSRGMDYLYYQISSRHQVTNFNLTISIDKLAVSLLNYPDGTLAPTNIKASADASGSILNWQFDSAITTAGMGVALLQPQQPGSDVFRVLSGGAFALTIFVSTIALTILLLSKSINFLDLGLFAAIYAAQFLMMASLSDTPLRFWGAWGAGAFLTLLLTGFVLRSQYRGLLRILLLGAVAFFAFIHPLAGLITDLSQLSAFDMLEKVGLIIYFAILVMAMRQKLPHIKPKNTPAADTT